MKEPGIQVFKWVIFKSSPPPKKGTLQKVMTSKEEIFKKKQ
jgi:hypothetical protein